MNFACSGVHIGGIILQVLFVSGFFSLNIMLLRFIRVVIRKDILGFKFFYLLIYFVGGHAQVGEKQREGETESQGDSVPSEQSPALGSNSQTVR